MKRFLPPVGVRLPATVLFPASAMACLGAGESHKPLNRFGATLGVKHVFGASCGRAAMCVALRALHALEPQRDVVAVPAYTCFSVPAAVIRAGLKICPLEMSRETLDIDLQQLDNLSSHRLLCIITANLFGFPSNISEISRVARAHGAFVLDDAAQSLGAFRSGRPSGTAADVGIFSLGRGKPLPAGKGGLVVTNSDRTAAALGAEIHALPHCSTAEEFTLLANAIATSIFINPHLYWIPNSMKSLKLGTTEFNPLFPITRLSRISRLVLARLLPSLTSLNQTRALKALQFAGILEGNSDFSTPTITDDAQPTYLRFPLLAKQPTVRDRAVRELRRAGIGATPFYPTAICDIPGIAGHMAVPNFHQPVAEEISQRLLTIPTHQFMRTEDFHRIAVMLSQGAERVRALRAAGHTAGVTA
jgi:dTDP-4-amino-4,6-dideoxygalactose transaminase